MNRKSNKRMQKAIGVEGNAEKIISVSLFFFL